MKLPFRPVLLTFGFAFLAAAAANGASSAGLSEREAVLRVAKKITLPRTEKNRVLEVDRVETRNGRRYFVVHGYHNVVDDPKTQEGHAATFGWYFVDCSTGSVLLQDLASDRLVRPR